MISLFRQNASSLFAAVSVCALFASAAPGAGQAQELRAASPSAEADCRSLMANLAAAANRVIFAHHYINQLPNAQITYHFDSRALRAAGFVVRQGNDFTLAGATAAVQQGLQSKFPNDSTGFVIVEEDRGFEGIRKHIIPLFPNKDATRDLTDTCLGSAQAAIAGAENYPRYDYERRQEWTAVGIRRENLLAMDMPLRPTHLYQSPALFSADTLRKDPALASDLVVQDSAIYAWVLREKRRFAEFAELVVAGNRYPVEFAQARLAALSRVSAPAATPSPAAALTSTATRLFRAETPRPIILSPAP